MSQVVAEAGTKVLRRRRALEPYLVQLGEALSLRPRDAALTALANLEGGALPLDPWLVSKIAPEEGAAAGPSGLADLILQCLALLMKSGADMAKLRREAQRSGAEFYGLQAELMLDSAVGMALLRETQKMVDDLVGLGFVEDARLLTRFQHRLRIAVRELKQSIAESNRGRADELVDHLTDQAELRSTSPEQAIEPAVAARPLPSRRPAEPSPTLARPARERSGERFRTEVLLGLVGVAAVAWIAGRGMPWLTERKARILVRGDFAASAPIREVVSRPPSLYVSVDTAAWEALGENQKLHLVEDMGSVLLTHGYWGLVVRTPEGKPVAWWRDSGAGLVAPFSPETAPAEEHAAPERYDRFVP